MKKILNFILFVFLFVNIPCTVIWSYDLDSAMKIVEAKYATMNDYTCSMAKKELVEGEYISWQKVIYKYKKYDNYYMKWTEGSQEGMEVIYAGKKYDYKMKVHLGGYLNLMNLSLDPKGATAMQKSRHPITESHLGFTIQLMRNSLQKAKNDKECKIEFIKAQSLNNRNVKIYKAEFPQNKGFYGHCIYIYLDDLYSLPVKFDVYDWNDKLLESYTFSDIKINVGLKDIDFDIYNKAYNF
jgi:outer membrane lipoprotein-sorting protein